MMNARVKRAIEAAGGVQSLARALGIQPPSIYSWRDIPPRRALKIAEITGIPASELRPDVFGVPKVENAA
ncbi:transcriptional regulator [Acetobacter orientalis]|uniref:transcriptional regulator n=1 Tax=Acetobacter orientalis TaxID=146474 RepID=UPI0039EB48FB